MEITANTLMNVQPMQLFLKKIVPHRQSKLFGGYKPQSLLALAIGLGLSERSIRL
jgi:hypothetical protein